MRMMIDSLIALMVVLILAGVVLHQRQEKTQGKDADETHANLRKISQQFKLKSVLGDVEVNERGYPLTVDPEWFDGKLPDNTLLGKGYPWIEIASASQKDLMHPLNPVATDYSIAKFWYNPSMGIVRARVPATLSDQEALQLYNLINDCQLKKLFQQ